MDHRKACPRTLDRPILVFGLEPEDLAGVGMVSIFILLAVDAVPAVIAGAVLWIGLAKAKSGRPPGFLYEALYRAGLAHRGPVWLRAPHLLRPGRRVLDPFPGGPDDEIRAYWDGRARLGG
jgi:hypothetical protein